MTRWLLLLIVLGLQGYCLGVQKNETGFSGHPSTQLKSMDTPPSAVPHTVNGEVKSLQDTRIDTVISSAPKYSTSTSNPRKRIEHTTTAPQTTTSSIPKTNTTTIKSRIKPSATEDKPLSKFPAQAEVKAKSPLPDPVTSFNLSSSQKPLIPTTVHSVTEETSRDEDNYESHRLLRKTTFPKTNGTEDIQAHTNRSEHSSIEEILGEPGASTSATGESAMELATLTPAATPAEEETSTLSYTENSDWSYSETNETETENSSENYFLYTTVDISTDPITTDLATEQSTEDSTAEGPSIHNGIASHENQSIRGVSSPLTKLILRLSKPGIFEKGKSVFEDDPPTMTTSCPPGDVGLSCRRAEAQRGADECSGGHCEVCRSCNNMAANDWPHCCRENFRCCSELALACQQCDQPTLQVFCTKHFKRCF